MLKQSISATRGLFRQHSTSGGLYFLAFYLCVGLLPAFITLFGSRALQLPFIAISVFTGFRLFSNGLYRKHFLSEIMKPYTLLLLAFCLLLFLHAVWGVFQDAAQLRNFQKPLTVLLFTIVLGHLCSTSDDVSALRLIRYLSVGILMALFLVAAEILWAQIFFSDQPGVVARAYRFLHIHKINRALEVVSVLVFLAALGIGNRLIGLYVAAILAVSLWVLSFFVLGSLKVQEEWIFAIHLRSETVQLGLPVAMLVFMAACRWPRLMTNIVFGVICFTLLAAPWLFQFLFEIATRNSLPVMGKLLIRAEIWQGVSRKILEAPFFGYGIDSARYLDHIEIAQIYFKKTIWHPHNMFLQIWLDVGLPGVLIICGLIVFCWRGVSSLDLSKRAPVLASVVMLSLFCLVTHSLWQTWSMALIAILSWIAFVVVKTLPAVDHNGNEGN